MNLELNYYSPSQIAALFSVSPKTVYRWLERGDLPSVQIKKGGVLRVPAAAVRALVATGEQPTLDADLTSRADALEAVESRHAAVSHV